MIENTKLNKAETKWLERMLSADFILKNDIVTQINQAEIVRQYTDFLVSIRFIEIQVENAYSAYTGVPVEMWVYLKNNSPIQFLLHLRHGIVYELEIFKADSSQIDSEINLDDAKINILIDSKWL